jgi:hypothetical protein
LKKLSQCRHIQHRLRQGCPKLTALLVKAFSFRFSKISIRRHDAKNNNAAPLSECDLIASNASNQIIQPSDGEFCALNFETRQSKRSFDLVIALHLFMVAINGLIWVNAPSNKVITACSSQCNFSIPADGND